MSTKDPNMKVIIGADTKDFDKGAKDVKQGLKDLSKTGDQAISSLGDAFGVNTGKVNQMVSAVRGLGARMTEASSTGVKAFGQLLGSITPLGGAIAGLGLAAAVAGFKALKAEADNFKFEEEICSDNLRYFAGGFRLPGISRRPCAGKKGAFFNGKRRPIQSDSFQYVCTQWHSCGCSVSFSERWKNN